MRGIRLKFRFAFLRLEGIFFQIMERGLHFSGIRNCLSGPKMLKCSPVLTFSNWHQYCNLKSREIRFPGTSNPSTMKTRLILLPLLLFTLGLNAQRNCHTVEYGRKLAAENPGAAFAISTAEDRVNAYLAASANRAARDTTANELINIPVVVHVLYNTAVQNISDAQILSQLEALNNDFSNSNADKGNRPGVFKNLSADVRIRFCLAQLDPQSKRTSGIERKYTGISTFWPDDAMKISSRGGIAAWNSRRYLNIWICPLNTRTLGYASSPGGPAELDGVVISYDVFGTIGSLRTGFNKGRTVTHEVGHWLGLRHLWGDSDCGDDGVDDTPRQRSYNFGCPSFPRVTTCSENSFGDMFMNFMDFSDDACMNMFTEGQKKRMRAYFAAGNARNTLLNAFACDSTLIGGGAIPGTGTNELPGNTGVEIKPFSFFPNPASGQLTFLNKTQGNTPQTISICSSEGKCVFKMQITGAQKTIPLSGIQPGLYYMNVSSGGSHWVEKVMIH